MDQNALSSPFGLTGLNLFPAPQQALGAPNNNNNASLSGGGNGTNKVITVTWKQIAIYMFLTFLFFVLMLLFLYHFWVKPKLVAAQKQQQQQQMQQQPVQQPVNNSPAQPYSPSNNLRTAFSEIDSELDMNVGLPNTIKRLEASCVQLKEQQEKHHANMVEFAKRLKYLYQASNIGYEDPSARRISYPPYQKAYYPVQQPIVFPQATMPPAVQAAVPTTITTAVTAQASAPNVPPVSPVSAVSPS